MHQKFRIILPLFMTLAVLALAASVLEEQLLTRWFTSDLVKRGQLIASALKIPVTSSLESGEMSGLKSYLESVAQDERLYAISICRRGSKEVLLASNLFPPQLDCSDEFLSKKQRFYSINKRLLFLTAAELSDLTLLLVHDLSLIERRSWEARIGLFVFFLLLAVAISAVTLLVVRKSLSAWSDELRSMIQHRGEATRTVPAELAPVMQEFRDFLRETESERWRVTDPSREPWTPARLRETLATRLKGEQVLIVANREPYIHNRNGAKIDVQYPASGVVSALEPIMRACSGVWIAHGSGTADRDVVDENDRIWVPPGEEAYQIRRIWLTPEEEQGYYYGLANEGLWPLSHIAHVRPVFRRSDWEHYRAVNERFASAVIKEAEKEDPIVLVQDYHFALLPALITERLPRATVITFWHIPWPNAESFSICPWQEEIIKGLLGSTIIGFHTRYHVNNFLDTVDRTLECRIDREHFTVSHQGLLTAVRSYPISIEFPSKMSSSAGDTAQCRAEILDRHKLSADSIIGLGVERLDYTKGLLERLWAIDRLFELDQDLLGKVTFIQIAAPSRSSIPSYERFASEVRDLANSINQKYPEVSPPPVIFLEQHFSPEEVIKYYRAANFCVVTSLHDGMNLVAKEYVASRDDEDGILLLSVFAGAARELPEALLINPYDIEECAETLRRAITMPKEERRQRIMAMREHIRQWNIYRWAAQMMTDAAEVRDKNRLHEVINQLDNESAINNG